MRRTLMVVCAAVALVAGACGGGDELVENILERQIEEGLEREGGGEVDINLDDDSFEINIEGDDGESMTFGGGDVPGSMDIDIPTGGDVINTFESGDDVSVTLSWPISEYDSLISFYEDWVDGQAGEWSKSTSSSQSDEGTIRTTSWWNYDNGSTNISIYDCFSFSGDGLDSVCVGLVRSQ